MVVVGVVLGGAALLCCGVGTVGALVDDGDPQGSTALATAAASTDPVETAAAAAAEPTPTPDVTTAPPVPTAPPTSAKPRVTTKPPATTRPAPRRTTPKPSRTTTKPARDCDPSYPTVCIPPAPPDLDCGDIPYRKFKVLPPDPHRLDGNDNDGIGCEST
jgi:hypothetical protein